MSSYPPSGRDCIRLVAECEDIAVEIYEFYKQNSPDMIVMMAIPSDIVLFEDQYFYKKKRFEQMWAT